jgi:DNA-binding transcriptional MerR regulator
MKNSTKKNYSIGDTAKMTGVTQKQIRNWEAKEYIPEATRVVSGERAYRRFSPEQIKIIHKDDWGRVLISALR